jgi:hypothetical protein
MNRRRLWRLPVVIGLLAMLAGAVDPLEGSLLILVGGALVALGGLLGHAPRRRLLYLACALMTAGVGAMFVLSSLGGTGGSSGRSNWWLLPVLPYPAGWILGVVGAILTLRDDLLRR